jgi:PAS domain S-box-containing protein
MFSNRRMVQICGLLITGSALAAFLFSAIAFHQDRKEIDASIASLGTFVSCTLLMISLLFFLYLNIRFQKQRDMMETMVHLVTPFWNSSEPELIDVHQVPRTIHHLMQSIDVQRNIMKRCFEHAPFGVLLIGKRSSVIYANSLFAEWSQHAPGELEQMQKSGNLTLFVSEEPEDDLLAAITESDTPISRNFCYLRRRDGEQVPVLITGFPLTSEQTDFDGFLLFVEDISPRHQLNILQQHFSFLLNSLNHGVLISDLNFRIRYVNDAFCQMWETKGEEVLNLSIAQIAAARLDGLAFDALRLAENALASGEEQTTEIRERLPSGRTRTLEISASPIKDLQSDSIGLLLLFLDRTAEKELYETIRSQDQLETVSQMAASIAHEVRNPMTSVQGFLQLMRREIDPAHAHAKYLRVMEEDLKRINSIITEYLTFSRMGSDLREEVSLHELLYNTYTLLESEANLKGIQIELLVTDGELRVIANPNRLKQVLINLARNAMEAMENQGGGVLILSLEASDGQACLLVRDTGPGIPAERLSDIFNPFFTTKKTGTGLGLFICKQIVDEHRGTIRVQSEPNRGTTFAVYLPTKP